MKFGSKSCACAFAVGRKWRNSHLTGVSCVGRRVKGCTYTRVDIDKNAVTDFGWMVRFLGKIGPDLTPDWAIRALFLKHAPGVYFYKYLSTHIHISNYIMAVVRACRQLRGEQQETLPNPTHWACKHRRCCECVCV